MSRQRKRLGDRGEDHACAKLAAAGMSILARNVRTRFGEIDVIALDGPALVFVEVKTLKVGSGRGPASPLQAVGPRKQLQIRRLARAWLAENTPPPCEEIRFDVVGVTVKPNGRARLEHVRAAF